MVSEQKISRLNSQEDFLETINPDTAGCIWITKGPVISNERSFQWFNYILDGTLDSRTQLSKKTPKSILVANQFNRSFYILQIEHHHPNLDAAIKDGLSLFKAEEKHNKVICLFATPITLSLESIKKNSKFNFEIFTY